MASVKSTAEIREAFLDYFERAGHTRVASSPLVPGNDPTLLFTNAGMVPFKDVFTGREARDYVRATSAQRCVRAGGKHNDLENVGYTARHHTFFEMLGNFSFGDYFKLDAIRHAWTLVTEGFGIPVDRLWVTVHLSDDEAERIWIEDIGVAPERVTRLGEDNFWSMGDTGPCGPCSEIFYDHGPDVPGGPPGSPDEDGDRYVEIWNLVFMQFERAADGTMTDLPKPSVDTGMGLERVAAVLQGVHSNYEIDLFRTLIDAVAAVTGASTGAADQLPSLRVVADHIRSSAFLVVDGVLPGNEGRGYVLRRIIRRALRHGHRLGQQEAFFHRLVAPLAEAMGAAYPELLRQQAHVERVLAQEEEQFARTLATGMAVFEEEAGRLDGTVIPGDVVFRLYDTYGFPVDLTADVARERGLTVDEAGFEEEMRAQRERARAASRFGASDDGLRVEEASAFTGYEQTADTAQILELHLLDEEGRASPVERLETGQSGLVVLDRTPFYAESGGQVGDTGVLTAAGGRFEVDDTQLAGNGRVHRGRLVDGALDRAGSVEAHVDAARRRRVALNHSATHLLHAVLREVLGDHVEQKGSLVAPDRLRFDFSHYQGVEAEELERIEARVNELIWANSEVGTRVMSFDAAREAGAMALFGEKYGDEVRVLSMGDGFSVELCGGTHVARTGDIGVFRITSEGGIASGIRRIEAVTGPGVVERMNERDGLLERVGGLLRSGPEEIASRVEALVAEQRSLEKQVAALQSRMAAAQGEALLSAATQVGDVSVLASVVEGVEPKALPDLLDSLRDRLGRAVVVLGSVQDGKVALIAGVSRDLTDQLRAGDIVKHVGAATGAKGGGRPDMARAGGGDRPEALPEALASVAALVRDALAA